VSEKDINDTDVPPENPMTGRQKFQLVGLVILKRLRFIAILLGVGIFIGYWDTVMNYWEKWTHSQSSVAQELDPGHEFYCPMDPQVVRSTYEPNGDVPKCPICGMPLSQRKKGETVKLPEGITGRVQLSPERIQLAGIKTVAVQYRPIVKQTKTVGYVTFDESRLSRIVSRVDGYVEKLYVNETFAVVHEGDPLAEIYSPELFSTAQELILASKNGGASDLAKAARNKLLLLGVSPQEIEGIAASRQPSPRLVIRSPQNGYVVEKKIVVGASVEAKMTLMEVADLVVVTGSQVNVRQAYKSGKPALGVGLGNAPVIIDTSADPAKAAHLIMLSKTFDHATSCSSENALVILDQVYDKAITALAKLCSFFDARILRAGDDGRHVRRKSLTICASRPTLYCPPPAVGCQLARFRPATAIDRPTPSSYHPAPSFLSWTPFAWRVSHAMPQLRRRRVVLGRYLLRRGAAAGDDRGTGGQTSWRCRRRATCDHRSQTRRDHRRQRARLVVASTRHAERTDCEARSGQPAVVARPKVCGHEGHRSIHRIDRRTHSGRDSATSFKQRRPSARDRRRLHLS
jgi:hypothetical protein